MLGGPGNPSSNPAFSEPHYRPVEESGGSCHLPLGAVGQCGGSHVHKVPRQVPATQYVPQACVTVISDTLRNRYYWLLLLIFPG